MTDADDRAAVRARSLWSGTLTFGLVSIPVYLFPAHRSTRASLRMLSPEGTPLSRRYYDPETGREVGRNGLVRGYEVDDGFVTVSDEELDSLAPGKSREIDLRRFVPRDQLDPLYFRRAYFLTPAGPSNKAYRLLARVMEGSDRAGIATFVMRGTEYLVAIVADDGILRAETLRFSEQVRSPEDVGLTDLPDPPADRVATLAKAVRSATAEALDEDELRDGESERLLELVEKKRKRGEGVVARPEDGTRDEGAEEEDEEVEVIDLMEVLRRSLAGEEAEGGEATG